MENSFLHTSPHRKICSADLCTSLLPSSVYQRSVEFQRTVMINNMADQLSAKVWNDVSLFPDRWAHSKKCAMLRPATNFKPGPPDWENPSVLHINKRPSHAPLRSITSLTEASAQFRRSSLLASISSHVEDKRRVQLSGCAWAFKLFPNPGAVPSDFAQTQFKTEGWTQVRARASHNRSAANGVMMCSD